MTEPTPRSEREIRALLEGVTAGPWAMDGSAIWQASGERENVLCAIPQGGIRVYAADLALMAAAPDLARQLFAAESEAVSLRAERDALTERLSACEAVDSMIARAIDAAESERDRLAAQLRAVEIVRDEFDRLYCGCYRAKIADRLAAALAGDVPPPAETRSIKALMTLDHMSSWDELADALDGDLRNHELADSGEYETTLRLPNGVVITSSDILVIFDGDPTDAEMGMAMIASLPVAASSPTPTETED